MRGARRPRHGRTRAAGAAAGNRSGLFRAPRGSVARQVFLWQMVLIVILVAAMAAVLVIQARRDNVHTAESRSLSAASALAHAPGTSAALTGPDPTRTLQPAVEQIIQDTGVENIVVFGTNRVRYTDHDPSRIGTRMTSTEPLPTHPVTRQADTVQLGPSVLSSVPVRDAAGRIVGAVAVAISLGSIDAELRDQLPLAGAATAAALVLATVNTSLAARRLRRQTHDMGPREMTRMYEHHDAVLHAVREGVLIVSGEGGAAVLVLANDEARRLLDLPPDAEGRRLDGLDLPPAMSELLLAGRPVTDQVVLAGDRLLVVNMRGTAERGQPGTVATLRDSTELRAVSDRADTARGRLGLLYEAGTRIGATLDVERTAQELAEVSVPRFADIVTVDVFPAITTGEEPSPSDTALLRVAAAGRPEDSAMVPAGTRLTLHPDEPDGAVIAAGSSLLDPALARAEHRPGGVWAALRATGVHSVVGVPLRTRDVVMGVACFHRTVGSAPFGAEDVSFAEEIVARATVSMDNARHYTREHTTAVTLQRSLLPSALPEQSALEVAYRYLPARAGVGGDWFDVIPLPGARVALVVGDVVGHGLHAAATMGRLRTAVQNFATLDLAPDELLTHLGELVGDMDREQAGGEDQVTGATCLYAVYDAVTGQFLMARAGHLGPALVLPDGTVSFPDVPASPPLGVGDPLEGATEITLAEGTAIVLFTDGLVEDRYQDIGVGLDRLRATLAERTPAGTPLPPEETCAAVLSSVLPPGQTDDVVLLVARSRILGPDHVAEWQVPQDPAAVSRIRSACARTLTSWGLDEIGYATELILSELITNAIRYGRPPIRVRLLRDRVLVCEVSDGSSTSPHLRHAKLSDEGGRGLFLVARFAERWGTRYTGTGKVIWTEQSLEPSTVADTGPLWDMDLFEDPGDGGGERGPGTAV
ncbi:SpoIIE family protein phosphatase [Streptomyces sp. NPDC058045]|uniref:SpoIIE family protein phosphatase n=1 Tax=Streptomyces sp. NPDC058045 TaxID=3346311 RepID=UPI0036E85F6C